MSRIAAMLALYAGAPITAEQAIAASRAMTSIGPDLCRRVPDDDEIVVCARRVNRYALPLDEPTDDASRHDGGRIDQMEDVRLSQGACARQGALCYPPPPYNGGSILRVLIKGMQALTDGD